MKGHLNAREVCRKSDLVAREKGGAEAEGALTLGPVVLLAVRVVRPRCPAPPTTIRMCRPCAMARVACENLRGRGGRRA